MFCCVNSVTAKTYLASSASEINGLANNASAGDTIIIQSGTYANAQLNLDISGTAAAPIVILAQAPGTVIFTGNSYLNFKGDFLELNGLVWEAVDPPYAQIISSKSGTEYANDCTIKNCIMIDCNPADPLENFKWIKLYGRRHKLINNTFQNKTNMGMMLSIYPDPSGPGEHLIQNNIFGPRPPVAGQNNGLEVIQIGQTYNAMANNSIIDGNYFYACDGEPELISVKLDGNTIRNNVIKECVGGIVLRMGHNNLIESNIFLGENKLGTAGVRVHGFNQTVINNYFLNLNVNSGSEQTYPIALMLGDADPENQAYYYPVENCTVANNTIYNCNRGISAGEDLSGQTVNPSSSWISNNIVLVDGDKCIKYTTPQDGISYEGNMLFRPDGGTLSDEPSGYIEIDPDLQLMAGDSIYRIHTLSPAVDASVGSYPMVEFDFESQARINTDTGADEFSGEPTALNIQLGPTWQMDSCVSKNVLNLHGYAAYAGVSGGNGHPVYIVNNTDDAGPGSYRDALSQSDRYITFDPSLAGQTIQLASDINTDASNITLDGSDAPGLIISKYATKFEGDNYILKYMRYHDMDATDNQDCITFRKAPVGGQKFYVFKCHFKNATDGCIDVIWNEGNDVYGTISHCKFEYTDKNFLIHAGSSTNEGGNYFITFDHNWFYKTGQRNPLARDAQVHHYNNLMEHWGGTNNNGAGAYSGTNANYLVQNDIAIAANVGDLNWEGVPIIVPKKKAFSPAWQETQTTIKSESNWYQNDAYHVNLNEADVFTPPYPYTLKVADNELENYIRTHANADYTIGTDCGPDEYTDLVSSFTMLPAIANGVTDLIAILTVQENEGYQTDGLVTVVFPKDNRLTMNWNATASMLGPFQVQNSVWDYDSSNASFHIWTTNSYVGPLSNLKLGFEASYDPQATTGMSNFLSTIITGSGGEVNGLNNVDTETILYFSN